MDAIEQGKEQGVHQGVREQDAHREISSAVVDALQLPAISPLGACARLSPAKARRKSDGRSRNWTESALRSGVE